MWLLRSLGMSSKPLDRVQVTSCPVRVAEPTKAAMHQNVQKSMGAMRETGEWAGEKRH